MKKGYTIIELIVVMTIIAIMSAIGVGTMINIRRNSEVDKKVEELLMLIREAQNNSISIKQDSSNHQTKVWSTKIDSAAKNAQILSFYQIGTAEYIEKTISFDNLNVTVNDSTNTSYDFINIAYSSPFGSSSITLGDLCITSTLCFWEVSSRPTREWETKQFNPSDKKVVNSVLNSNIETEIVLDNGSYSRKIKVNAKGDARIE